MNNSANITFSNQTAISVDGGGWAQLAPFGDFPGQAMLRQADGSILKFPAVQRLDCAAADTMVRRFKSPWQRFKRFFTGCPIYAGHPDVPGFANEYRDAMPKGMVVDLETRAEGLFCKPVFTQAASEQIENGQLRALSAYWSANEIGEQTGANGETIKIFRPEMLHSAGLTNRPNLPVQLLNDGRTSLKPNRNPQPNETKNEIVNKQIIIHFLASQGITLANEAGEEQIAAALEKLGERVAIAETTLAARNLEFETLNTTLANELKFHADALLDSAQAAGRITAAQRSEWAARLQMDFANASSALAELTPVLKTTALTQHLGSRKAEIANAGGRRDALDALLQAEMAKNGGDYDRAFAAVQKANPALFAAMKKPF